MMGTMELTLYVLSVISLTQLVYSQRTAEIAGATLTFECPWRPRSVNYPEHDLYAAGIHVHNVNHVVFMAKGKNDAHILLKKDRNDFTNNVVEIVIGGWRNTQSVIRDRQQGRPAMATYNPVPISHLLRQHYWLVGLIWLTPSHVTCLRHVTRQVVLTKEMRDLRKLHQRDTLLIESNHKAFWASWVGTCIKVGKGRLVGENELMSWCGNNHAINYISASFGYGSGGSFKFLRTATELTYYSAFWSSSVDYYEHDLFADGIDIRSTKSIVFAIKGRNDAHVLLKSSQHEYNNKVIEIVLGGWKDSKSVIRDGQQGPALAEYLGQVLFIVMKRYYWISWENNCIKVGKGYSVGKLTMMTWCGMTHDVNYISASYGFASQGYFLFHRTAGAPV